MHKKLFFVLVLALALLVGVVSVSAQAPAGTGWWVGFSVQNVDSAQIDMSATAYHKTTSSNTTVYNAQTQIPAGFAVVFHPGFPGNCGTTATNGCLLAFDEDLPAGFEGSVVIGSTGPAVAVANVNNLVAGSVGVSGGTARAAYQGTSGIIAADTLYFPTVKNNFAGQTTAFFVQAAGADAEVTITYKLNDGDTESQTVNIDANKMFVFTPSGAGVDSCNGGTGGGANVAPCFGGATVTSDAPVAGTVVEFQEGVTAAEFVLSTRGITPNDLGDTIIIPALKNQFFGGTTGLVIFNSDLSSTASVDVDFSVTFVDPPCSASVGDTASETVTVGPLQSVVIANTLGNVGGLPDCVFYAATASTTSGGGELIAATINETRVTGPDTFKAVYTAFNQDNATATIFTPVVKEDFLGNTTGLTLVNGGAVATKINVTYTGPSNTHVLQTKLLQPGEAVALRQVYKGPVNGNFVVLSGGLPTAGTLYAVTAVADTGGGTIFGQAQEASVSGTVLDVYNVEMFNQ